MYVHINEGETGDSTLPSTVEEYYVPLLVEMSPHAQLPAHSGIIWVTNGIIRVECTCTVDATELSAAPPVGARGAVTGVHGRKW